MSTSSTVSKKQQLSYKDITPQQQRSIDALYRGNTLLVAQKGHGKTVVGQTAAQELIDAGELKRVLIVAPLKVAQLSWRTEHEGWEHLEEVGMAVGNAGERLGAINDDHRIVVINYDVLPWLFETGGYKSFDGLLLDECGKLKAVGSKGVKVLRRHREHFSWICGMSASPVAEQGGDIYSQALIIDGGAALGTRLDKFREQYLYPTDFQQRKWALQPGAEARLSEAVKDMIYMADDTEYEASLPELRDEVVHVTMPPEGWQAYTQMCDEMYIDVGEVEAANQAVVSGKLLQVASGAYYDNDKNVHDLHQAKYDALHALIQAAQGPVAVAYQFQFQLDELRLRHRELRVLGDNPEAVEADWNAGNISLMALHPKSAGHGLNLQYGGHELIVLTPIWSSDQNEQLVGRFRRRGQRSKYVRRTTLVVQGTVDELVIERQLGKVQDEQSLMGHIKSVARK